MLLVTYAATLDVDQVVSLPPPFKAGGRKLVAKRYLRRTRRFIDGLSVFVGRHFSVAKTILGVRSQDIPVPQKTAQSRKPMTMEMMKLRRRSSFVDHNARSPFSRDSYHNLII